MIKIFVLAYFLITILLSFYFHFHATTFLRFFLGGLITSLFFTGIYLCFKNISSNNIKIRLAKFCGVVVLSFLIFLSYAFVEALTSDSNNCVEIATSDIFTKETNVQCKGNSPWHTDVIGGEEARNILLQHCIRISAQIKRDEHYCDVYKNPPAGKDWTRGTVLGS